MNFGSSILSKRIYESAPQDRKSHGHAWASVSIRVFLNTSIR